MISFLSDVLTPAEKKQVGMTHPAERWWPVTDKYRARDAMMSLTWTRNHDKMTELDKLIIAKLYGALYATYPELMELSDDYKRR